MSVSSRSPTIKGCPPPARVRAASKIGAFGLPTTSAVTPVVAWIAASRAPAPGQRWPPGAGKEVSGFVAIRARSGLDL